MNEKDAGGRRPTLHELWMQADGGTDGYDTERYLDLMREHGHIVRRNGPCDLCAGMTRVRCDNCPPTA